MMVGISYRPPILGIYDKVLAAEVAPVERGKCLPHAKHSWFQLAQ